ncbi:hypothetical protein LOD99_15915 [Oopsacas minuta]|uniref:Uncharacterized protein n=1 Tax=Oopsacas minuta TaxID=111878 RepID=A0AAV7K8Z4_9METZ|nr:hypothetical protein LOD99_15915 [Oopsacas minuta]
MATEGRIILNDKNTVNFKELEVPRRRTRFAIAIAAGPAITPVVVYSEPRSFVKGTIYLPMVYGFTQEIQSRFSENDQEVLCALAVLIMHPEKQDVKKEAALVADFYEIDEDNFLSERKSIVGPLKDDVSSVLRLPTNFLNGYMKMEFQNFFPRSLYWHKFLRPLVVPSVPFLPYVE